MCWKMFFVFLFFFFNVQPAGESIRSVSSVHTRTRTHADVRCTIWLCCFFATENTLTFAAISRNEGMYHKTTRQ